MNHGKLTSKRSVPRPRSGSHDQGRDGPADIDVAAAIRELFAGLLAQPWGQVSPSTYETGRVVTLAPWLTGHGARVAYLVGAQRTDGGWGGIDAYGLVPTLSATESLLSTARRIARAGLEAGGSADYGAVVASVARGLRALFEWLRRPGTLSIPDTPAIELIIPMLIADINRHLEDLRDSPLTGLDAWRGTARLDLPAGMDHGQVAGIRAGLRAGEQVPAKLLHALEVAGQAARGACGVRPAPSGAIGASPAATAAWLGDREPQLVDQPSRRYLEDVVRRTGGPMPCAMPITAFERAWVLGGLARTMTLPGSAGGRLRSSSAGGSPLSVPDELVTSLTTALGDHGTPGGPGLPPDADTTAATLFALAQLGTFCEPDSLWEYELDTHFCTWRGEQGVSTSVNAHVLDAFGCAVCGDADAASRRAAAVDKVSRWLCEQQLDDGSWTDRWHASPYYATWCCVMALDNYGHESSAAAVRGALSWVLASQRDDGSWGRWSGTVEETAYAVQIVLGTRHARTVAHELAAARGYNYLLTSADRRDDPPLWHDKDLYRPNAIVAAAVLTAMYLAHTDPVVAARARDLRPPTFEP